MILLAVKGPSPARTIPRSMPRVEPVPVTAESIRCFLQASRASRKDSKYDFPVLAPFQVLARQRGERMFSRWFEGVSPFRVIEAALAEAPGADVLELCVTTGFHALDLTSCSAALSNRNRGRYGAQIVLHGMVHRVSPLETIACNRSLKSWFGNVAAMQGLSERRFFESGGKLSLIECRQFIISMSGRGSVIEAYRGNEVVDPNTSTTALCDDVMAGMGKWLMTNVGADGALPYKYWPSSGKHSEADNPIRRFMATIAFNRLATMLKSRDMRLAAKRNLAFNLRRFYRSKADLGVIEWDGSIKLGAVALAGLAILESPFSEQWDVELRALRATVDHLWSADGSFRTFLEPAERNDNQNFYPGEALLFQALSLRRVLDETLLRKTLRSLWTYRDHFHRDPNPAFVPWHAQTAAALFEITGNPDLRDYVFQLIDWLLPHQQWGGDLDPDLWGRFYSPHRPHYGPPHASSTGVYLEGIVDAWKIAKAVGDSGRVKIYGESFRRGLRSIAQLQFKNGCDTYYITRKDRVLGAVRTEAYDNEIRVDNLQHALMALLKFRSSDLAEPESSAE
ncbi:MAG: hypothetical protein AB7F09_18780 [Parvibaculaceae bacterium]